MRFRLSLAALALVAVPVAVMSVVSACGSADDTLTDAAKDGTTDHPTLDVVNEPAVEAGCDAPDLKGYLPADGGLDVDAGGFALGACLGCFQSNCSGEINACNADCYCRQGVIDSVTCITTTGDLQGCFLSALGSGNTNLQNLFGCAYSKCGTICLSDGGTAKDSGGDAPSDAPGG